MEVHATFRERLLLARRRAGLEQRELGALVGLTGDTIGRLERGRTKQISIEALRQLAQVLKVSTDWLLAMNTLGQETTDDADANLIVTPYAYAPWNSSQRRGSTRLPGSSAFFILAARMGLMAEKNLRLPNDNLIALFHAAHEERRWKRPSSRWAIGD